MPLAYVHTCRARTEQMDASSVVIHLSSSLTMCAVVHIEAGNTTALKESRRGEMEWGGAGSSKARSNRIDLVGGFSCFFLCTGISAYWRRPRITTKEEKSVWFYRAFATNRLVGVNTIVPCLFIYFVCVCCVTCACVKHVPICLGYLTFDACW